MSDQKDQVFKKRIAQGIGLLSFFMLFAVGILAFLYRQTIVVLIDSEFGYVLILFAINAIVSIVLALLVVSRNPGQVIGWLFLTIGFIFSWFEMSNIMLGLYGLEGIPGPMRPFVVLGGMAYLLPLMLTLGLVPLYFPDGRLPSRRWRPVLVIVLIGIVGQSVAQGFLDYFIEMPRPENAGVESFFTWLQDISEPILIVGIVGSLASLVVRFIRSGGDKRTQMKWLVYTATMSILVMFLMVYFLGEDSLILGVYSSSIPTILTLAIGLAILRYRLYDIDIIIRRTLIYAALTGTLAVVYFVIVVVLQQFLPAQTQLTTVLSTLTIAALFSPLRRRIQNDIDRLFFRRRYDAEKTLAAFAASVRDEVDLEELNVALMEVIEDTMQPDHVSLWLRQEQSKV